MSLRRAWGGPNEGTGEAQRPATLSDPSVVGAVLGLRHVTRALAGLVFVCLSWLLLGAAGIPAWSGAVFAGGMAGVAALLGIRIALTRRLRARLGNAPLALHPEGGWVTAWPSRHTLGWRVDLGAPTVRAGPLLAPMLLLLLLAGLQLVPDPAGRQTSVDPAATLRGGAFLALLALLHSAATTLSSLPRDAARRDRALAVLGGGVALAALAQYASGTTRIWGLIEPTQPGIPFGPFWYRNHFGTFVVLVLPLAMGELSRRVARLRESWGPSRGRFSLRLADAEGLAVLEWSVPPALLLASLVATTSRGALLALLCGLVLSALVCRVRPRRAAFAIVGTLAFVALALAFAGPDRLLGRFGHARADSSDRVEGWKAGLALWRERPRFGWGLGAYPAALALHPPLQAHVGAVHRHLLLAPHCDYLQLGAEMGWPALVVAVGGALAALRKARGDPWAFASLTGLLLHAAIDFPMGVPALSALAVVIAAPARAPDTQRACGEAPSSRVVDWAP